MTLRLGFIGAGHLGSVLAAALDGAGYPVVAVASRGGASAARVAGRLSRARWAADPQAVVDAADLTFLAVSDDAIQPVASALRWRPGRSVVHCSGALEVLPALEQPRAAGALVGSFHPLQIFTDPEAASVWLSRSAVALDGDEPLLAQLDELVRALGGRPLRLPPGARTAYHLAASFACAGVVAQLAAAQDAWADFADRAGAMDALLPLVEGTVATLRRLGPAAALAGPVARADLGTLARHAHALTSLPAADRQLYRAFSQVALDLASHRLSPEQASAVAARLADTAR